MTPQNTFAHVVACVFFALCILPSSIAACPFAVRSASNSSHPLPPPQKTKPLEDAAVRVSKQPKTWDTTNCRKRCLRKKVWRIAKANNGQEVANLLQAIFHDHQACALDGSIRFELDRRGNSPLRGTSRKVVAAAYSCGCSVADTFALGAKFALRLAGGPRLRMSWGHKDATKANPKGNLPKGSSDADTLRKVLYQYNDEAIALLSSAHNIGHGHTRGKDGTFKQAPFTTNEKLFNNEYFKNLLHIHKYGHSPKNTFQLPSDRALIQDDKFLYIVKAYAEDDDLYRYHFKLAMELMISDFTECN